MKSGKDIVTLVERDSWMLSVLQAAGQLNLPDWWICAGFVRSKVWDVLHGYTIKTKLPDIDVIYFDKTNIQEDYEKKLELRLGEILPDLPWSVKNQARMHKVNHMEPYSSSYEAMSNFPETATALGVRFNEKGKVDLAAPWGVNDLLALEVRPTPFFSKSGPYHQVYKDRRAKKGWDHTWPEIKIFAE
ncbi:nucleotidyltransferase family protein [Bacillus sp. MUM 13]|uniref:nucleotidyltransferase family protein n=1 Tax=Bacillus sp. MUM 13 TaxID=1678001 RepID=UPI0008F5A94D|nr:nucleotidyltransferase family protein [Bacillus sp. MUM 13]OIK14945.1 hypothetical protein BIV59_01850 [Bacillus sp. MUM 13]